MFTVLVMRRVRSKHSGAWVVTGKDVVNFHRETLSRAIADAESMRRLTRKGTLIVVWDCADASQADLHRIEV